MSIKWRLAISYFVLILVPLIIGLIGLAGIFFALIGRVPSLQESLKQPGNPIVALFDQQLSTYAELQDIVRTEPDALLDPMQLVEWEAEAAQWNVGLLIWKNEQLVYQSFALHRVDAERMRWEETLDHDDRHEMGWDRYDRNMRGEDGTLIKMWPVRFADQSQGEVWLVSDQGTFGRFVGASFDWFLGGLIFVLILTMTILVWRVSRTFVKPLQALTAATERIQAGDLAFSIQSERKDEIGRLADSFDRMRARLQEAAEQARLDEQNRKELIANISHDLRTPVTAIRGYAEAMVDGLTGQQETDLRYASQIVKKSQQLQHLIQELFDLSLLEMGQKKFEFEDVELSRFLQDCTEEWQLDLQEKHILVSFQSMVQLEKESDVKDVMIEQETIVDHQAVIVQADRSELQRVLVNILDNAVKSFQGKAGEIQIQLMPSSDHVTIQIHDNGCGMPAELVPFVFDRFTRADASRGSKGAGLGLAIAKQIIRAHQGFISASSTEGKGTIITIELPFQKK